MLLICFKSKAQPPKVNTDSIQRVKVDSIQKLITYELKISAAMIDSTVERIKNKVTAKDYELYNGAYQFFINELVAYWLDLNRRQKKK